MNEFNFQRIDDNNWYITTKLPENIISYLWDCVHRAEEENIDHRERLVGNISRSLSMKDPDNVMVDKVFAGLFNSELQPAFVRQIEQSFYRVYSKRKTFGHGADPVLEELWVNFQKKYEYNPLHDHGGMFSFVIWMKIPTEWRDQHALPICANSNAPLAGDFQIH